MKEYFICILFWIAFTLLISMFGKALAVGEQSFSFKFLAGYLTYSFFVAIGGIIVQVANLPWKSFAAYMVVLWGGIIAFIVFRVVKDKVKVCHFSLIGYIKENWVLLAVCLIFSGMLFFYYNPFWYGNHLDDGYYITKVATMPYNISGFRTNYSVGTEAMGLDAYLLNTWELEASVYVKILSVKATLFLRLFQSAFHYFLFLNCVKLFAEKLMRAVCNKIKTTEAQFVLAVTLLFGIYYLFLMDTNLFFVRDMFQFNSGMFLGTGIVKPLGMILLLAFYIDCKKINIKMILGVTAIAVVLISKSSVILPIIVITVVAYVWSCWLFQYGRKGILLFGITGGIYVITAIFLSNGAGAQAETYKFVRTSLRSPAVIICIVIFILSFTLKNRLINRLNCMLLMAAALMVVPQINDVFELASVYAFVAGRAWSTYIYTFVIVNAVYLYLLLRKYLRKVQYVQGVFGMIGIALTVTMLYAFASYGGELFLNDNPPVKASYKESLKVMIGNHYFVPNSTIELGTKLEALSDECGEQLYVVSPENSDLNGTVHTLAILLRTFAPDVISVSASGRYSVSEESGLKGYDQSCYDEFVWEPTQETSAAFKEQLNTYSINCVVLRNPDCSEYMQEMGYRLYATVEGGIYDIWYKE